MIISDDASIPYWFLACTVPEDTIRFLYEYKINELQSFLEMIISDGASIPYWVLACIVPEDTIRFLCEYKINELLSFL